MALRWKSSEATHLWLRKSVRPVQGSKTPKWGKEGFGVKNAHFPPTPEARLESKNPRFYTGHHTENGDFLTQDALFLGWGGNGVFLTPKPSFPDFGVLTQSRKCAINNFWTKNPLGLLGWGSRGSRQIIYVRIFSNIWSVFGTTSRPNINNFRDRRPA